MQATKVLNSLWLACRADSFALSELYRVFNFNPGFRYAPPWAKISRALGRLVNPLQQLTFRNKAHFATGFSQGRGLSSRLPVGRGRFPRRNMGEDLSEPGVIEVTDGRVAVRFDPFRMLNSE